MEHGGGVVWEVPPGIYYGDSSAQDNGRSIYSTENTWVQDESQ